MTADPSANYLLIIASSARMLVQAAYQEGFKPLVIDLFADTDTQHYASAWRQVASLSVSALIPVCEHFFSHYPVAGIIYGSGFESFPESLSYLHKKGVMLGNTPETFANIINKRTFFTVLDEHLIPYPDSVFSAPDSGAWLSKPLYGQGGIGIKHWRPGQPPDGLYWQTYQTGIPHSALFLADGQNVQVLGFNQQWTVADGEQAFLFAGIINSTDLSDRHKALITDWLATLVPIFKIRGLNSLDFIQEGDTLWLLEINPRPSASMQLYTGDVLTRHINACAGRLPDNPLPDSGVCAYQIVYAPDTVYIPSTIAWPKECVDVPLSGTVCRTGQPICSIIVHQKTTQTVYEQLQYQHRAIFSQLSVVNHPS